LDNCEPGALNLETEDQVKENANATSMHHNMLNLKFKEAEYVFQFDQPNTVHGVYNVLTNYVMRSDK
jgi:hypothetical protein